MRIYGWLIAVIAVTTPADAQTARVRGIVFDSVAMAPLAGAIVQMARVDSGQRVFSAITDAVGRFAFDTLPQGSYGIGFQHAALTALGLDAPIRAIRLREGSSVALNLAIPSGALVRALTCRTALTDTTEGLLAGYVYDALRGAPLEGATVTARWVELGLVGGAFRSVPRAVSMTAGDDGVFRICGIASDAEIRLAVVRPGFRDLATEVTIPSGSTLRFDVRLVDSTATRGNASVTGRVVQMDGSLIPSGQVRVNELGVDAPITNGAFTIGGLPPGTWSLETRVLGYEPQVVLVDAAEGAPASIEVRLADRIQVLDAITVFGTASGDIKVLDGIIERRRTSFGTTFLPGNPWLRSALNISDVLQTARGFRYLSIDDVRARGCSEPTSILGLGARQLVLYLDGTRFAGSLSELQHQVQIRDVLAVEAYPDPQSIPGVWRHRDACALIAVWTKRM